MGNDRQEGRMEEGAGTVPWVLPAPSFLSLPAHSISLSLLLPFYSSCLLAPSFSALIHHACLPFSPLPSPYLITCDGQAWVGQNDDMTDDGDRASSDRTGQDLPFLPSVVGWDEQGWRG